MAADDQITGVRVDNGWRATVMTRRQFERILAEGDTPPLLRKCGLELAVLREHAGPSNDNQPATWLMIEPHNGFAPWHWQKQVGPVVVVRRDGRDYTQADHCLVHDYVSEFLDECGEGIPPAGVVAFQRALRRIVLRNPGSERSPLLLPRVRLQGLEANEELNGAAGYGGEEVDGRIPVYLDSGRSVRAKPAKVVPLADSA